MDGAEIFKMKDTHGLPFSISFEQCENRGLMIDWIGLLNAARKHGWWDFQTIEQIEEGFHDSRAWQDKRDEILNRLKIYIMANPI